MAHDLIRLMQSFFPAHTAEPRPAAWQPAVDVYRTATGWLLKFDLAGVRPEEVSLKAEGDRITVQGVRRDAEVERGCHYYRMEISYNHFERTVELPCCLDLATLETDYRHGMLLVHVRTEEALR